MTTKDELLELINVFIESYEGEYDNATEAKWNSYWGEKVQQLRQIRSIIEQRFSVSDEERREAKKWLKFHIGFGIKFHIGFGACTSDKEYQTILKALGGVE